MAASTIRQVHFILRAALGQAMKWGWIDRNPAGLATPPRVGPPEPHAPNPADVARLLEAAWARDPDFGTFLWLATMTGARRGEVCALRWSDLDVDQRMLVISRNYVQTRKGRLEKDTKTHQRRPVALDDTTIELLSAHQERARARAKLAGVELPASGYVFSDEPDGTIPWLPDRITQRVRRLIGRLGLAGRLHDLRHFSATQLLTSGVDLRTVAGRLGHGGGGATTLRVYVSPVTEADRRAADLLRQRLPTLGEPASGFLPPLRPDRPAQRDHRPG